MITRLFGDRKEKVTKNHQEEGGIQELTKKEELKWFINQIDTDERVSSLAKKWRNIVSS
jgi:hypothetical protein